MTLFTDFIDKLVDCLNNRVERVFISGQQHPRRERACTLAVEMVEDQVGQFVRRYHPATHLDYGLGDFATDIVAHIRRQRPLKPRRRPEMVQQIGMRPPDPSGDRL